jgi:hypothetical protein
MRIIQKALDIMTLGGLIHAIIYLTLGLITLSH